MSEQTMTVDLLVKKFGTIAVKYERNEPQIVTIGDYLHDVEFLLDAYHELKNSLQGGDKEDMEASKSDG